MPIDVSFNKSDNCAVFRVTGEITTAAHFTAEYEKVLDHPELVRNMHAIWDITGLELKRIPIAEFRALPRVVSRFSAQRGAGYKAAIVTRRSGDQLLLKLYLSILKMIPGVSIRLFDSVPAAQVWIERGKKAA